MKQVILRMVAGCFAVALVSPLFAQEDHEVSSGPKTDAESPSSGTKSWQFVVAPYGWLTGADVTVFSDGDETNINIPFKDILKEVNGGFMLYAEARWRRWFGAFDGTWASLGGTIEGRLFETDVSVTERIFDLHVGYQVVGKQFAETAGRRGKVWRRSMLVEIFVGGRYFDTEIDIVETPEIGNGDPRSQTFEEQRWDPFVGVRVGYRFSDSWAFKFRGDIGGFGIGNAAQFTWQVFPLLEYRLSHLVTLDFGYRVLDVDTVEGQGADRNGSNMVMSGPVIGAAFRF